MSQYDYLTNDHIGRTVEVTDGLFRQTRTTIDGGGGRSTTSTLFPW